VYLKCENLQVTGAFKARGAFNFVLSLLDQGGAPGVITASSGNHGQAVAYAAARMGLPCTVVVPEDVIAVKAQAIRSYGAKVEYAGHTSTDRIERAEQLATQQGWVFVPPYDHPWTAAGQGTAGLEILQQRPDVSVVLVPIGGGGLISGVATAIKETRPEVRVIGVEPELANDTYLSLQAGRVVDIGANHTLADGLRTSHPGDYTFPIVQRYVDEVVLVSEQDIENAARELLFRSKLLVEPSGAVTVAALRQLDVQRAGTGSVVCLLSGGNADPNWLATLLGNPVVGQGALQ
jgi:threonine dehydratase